MAKVAKFVGADARYLVHADDPALSVGDIFWDLVVWANYATMPPAAGNYGLVAKWNADNEYLLRMVNDDPPIYLQFFAQKADNSGNVNVATTIPLEVGKWYMVHIWHNPTVNLIGLDVNCQAEPVTAVIPAGIRDAANEFWVGTWGGTFHDGRVGPLSIWKGAANLTLAQLQQLYNGGYGLTHANLDETLLAMLTAWYQMDEVTGARVEHVGAINLAEVGGAINSEESLLGVPASLLSF